MKPCKVGTHLLQIDHFLSLEPVQVGLYRHGRVPQILRQRLQRPVKLKAESECQLSRKEECISNEKLSSESRNLALPSQVLYASFD